MRGPGACAILDLEGEQAPVTTRAIKRAALDGTQVKGGVLVGEDEQIRILVADSDPRVRSALQTLLRQEALPIVLRESCDMGSLATQVKQFRPQLVLLQWELPGRPAAALLFALHGLETKPKIIVLSTRPESEQAVLASGADAFVSKGDPPERLLVTFRGMVQDLRQPPGELARA